MKKIAAIILAAGQGKRMNSKNYNKVVLKLADKHIITYAIDLLDKLKIKEKFVVVGFAKESVVNVLGDRVKYVVQRKRLGTAHAVMCALKEIDKNTTDILVFQGDDSALWEEKTIKEIINLHASSGADFTLLTIDVDDPFGLGRVVRDRYGKITRIIEEKDATTKEKEIKEINPACYLISVKFLRKYLKKIKKSKETGEYYLTSLVNIAIKNNEKIKSVKGDRIQWRGINTPQELKEAEEIFKKTRN